MLAKQGLITFLVGKSDFPISQINNALNDLIEQYSEELRFLSSSDYQEIERIRKNPSLLTKSYLFKTIEPFLLPFYRRNWNSTSL